MTGRSPTFPPLDKAQQISHGAYSDPFSILGPHESDGKTILTVFEPGAAKIDALVNGDRIPLLPLTGAVGVFSGEIPHGADYTVLATGADDNSWEREDPYKFGPVIGEMDEYLLAEGTHKRLWTQIGAHVISHEGSNGTHFAVWAPNAHRVAVVGEFNQWDGRRHVMRQRGSTGIWEIFLPGIDEGAKYKFEILGNDGAMQPLKADPVGFGAEHPPETASVVRDISGYGWGDADWMASRWQHNDRKAPISIYEVHLGSWRRRNDEGNRMLSYKEAAEELVAYVSELGFTHIELLPVSEHPFDGSWGYQPVGLFAPTIRHGPPHEFRDLVDAAHMAGLGVILDWVPGHFPTDAHGLGRFDGTPLYEHADPREGFHQDWNTLIYNFGRTEVANFLISNALYWLEEYHIDGLRVDAVASMLYRDYSRDEGEWIPNKDGGRENYEAIELLQRMNATVYGEVPGILTAAEESTSFPGVSQPVDGGGLGFGFKWNMGWMNDTLRYIEKDPVYRKYDHNLMTAPMMWAYSENFILPISHDEVVHGKGSMLAKMPGNEWEKFANLRAYYGYMWGFPGKKLLFMGCEFAQPGEWRQSEQIDWEAAQTPYHSGIRDLVRDLNKVYRSTPALHALDCESGGFRWLEANDSERSIYAWARYGEEGDPSAVVICNFTPVERSAWRCGLPRPGRWREALNTDAGTYGGGNRGNMGTIETQDVAWHDQQFSAEIVLPPLSTVILISEDA